jgi:hypothetical protein
MAAWLQLAARRRYGEQAEKLILMRTAQHAEPQAFQKHIRKLQDESE